MGKNIGSVNVDKMHLDIQEKELKRGDIDIPVDKLSEVLSSKLTSVSLIIQNLPLCGLNDILRPMRDLNALKDLVLSYNELREVPSCLYTGFKHLELLDLSHNKLRSFDIEPACVSNLKVLKINDNQMQDLPQWVLVSQSNLCSNLEEITYSNNAVKSLRTECDLKLEKLVMCNTNLIDVDLKFFKKLKKLQYLDIGNAEGSRSLENRFSDLDRLFAHPKWENLEVIKLNNLCVSMIPVGIFWLSCLKELHLAGCALSWIPSDVKYLQNLEVLDVSDNNICSLPKELLSLTSLKALDLYSNTVDDFAEDLYERLDFLDLENNYYEPSSSSKFYEKYCTKRDKWRQKCGQTKRLNGRRAPAKELYDSESDSSRSYSDYSLDLNSDDEQIEDSNKEQACVNENNLSSLIGCQEEPWDQDNNRTNSPNDSEENWDLVRPVKKTERHPDITPSDDEWTGHEVIRRKKSKFKQEDQYFLKQYHVEYDFLQFCDAD